MAKLKCTRLVRRLLRGKTASQKCGDPAIEYEVSGNSYSCRAVLCDAHADLAKREGFTLKPITAEAKAS